MKHGVRRLYCLAALAALVVLILGLAQAQQIHRNGFEVREPLWVKGPADAPFKELAHRMDDVAHTGQRSEYIQIDAEQGTSVQYLYDPGRAPVTDDLNVTLWLKGNRPGVQLLARLVLPKERNPNNLNEPLTTVLRGDVYRLAGRWQKMELRKPTKLVVDLQQLLRVQLNRDVNTADAYVDRIMLNVYAGPGQTEAYIDDLEVGPVIDTPPEPVKDGAGGRDTLTGRPIPKRPAIIDLDRDQLSVGGKRFFFRAIRHTDTPLKVLRDAGFNTVWLDSQADPRTLDEAVNLGFWLVPSLPLAQGRDTTVSRGGDNRLVSESILGQTVSRFTEQDAVLFWDVGGGGLTMEQADTVATTAQLVHRTDPQRPLGADVWDGFQAYSRHVNLLGVHRWPLMTSLELPQYREWLEQRRLLANPGTFTWTWVQTHLPDWHTQLVYQRKGTDSFDEPIGPLPEQIRLLTYTSLAAGVRGLGFWSDRFLADSHQGRDRLLQMALLNQELQMLEPLLVTAGYPTWVDTSDINVKAAVFRCERAVLVLPMWVGRGAQYVPGQASAANLNIVVPQVPQSATAWEVTPGFVRALPTSRVPGGTRVVVPEFGLTSALVFTGDNGPTGLLVHLQDQARKRRKLAAQWAHDLAEVEMEKVQKVQEQLEHLDHHFPEEKRLLEDARTRLASSVKQYNDGDFQEAYLDAQRAVRPLRILMRTQWEKAAGDLDTPAASPYTVSFFTLPRHWRFVEELMRKGPAANALPNGDFEMEPERTTEAWQSQEMTVDEVEMSAQRVSEKPHGGSRCLLLEIKPKNPQAPPAALERTFLAIHSPSVRLQPGTFVRVTGWLKVMEPIKASADGALLYDSAGGEPLGVRLTGATKDWKPFTFYRKVPETGMINVTLALTGIGKVYFDDLHIEPLVAGQGSVGTVGDDGELTLRSPKPDDPDAVQPPYRAIPYVAPKQENDKKHPQPKPQPKKPQPKPQSPRPAEKPSSWLKPVPGPQDQ